MGVAPGDDSIQTSEEILAKKKNKKTCPLHHGGEQVDSILALQWLAEFLLLLSSAVASACCQSSLPNVLPKSLKYVSLKRVSLRNTK